MKRTKSLLILVFLVTLCALILAACSDGGVTTQQQWDDAMNYLRESNTVTIKIDKDDYTNLRVQQTTDVSTLTYDGAKGMLFVDQLIKKYNVGFREYTHHIQTFYVVDGSDLKRYYKLEIDEQSKKWEASLQSFDSAEDALLALKNIYLDFLTENDIDTWSFDHFTFAKNKFEHTEVRNQQNHLQQVTFSDGHLTKIYLESKPTSDKNSINTSKNTITVKYSATLSAPDDLDNATWTE